MAMARMADPHLAAVVFESLRWRGVLRVQLLSSEERARVSAIEEKFSAGRGPLGRAVNLGVVECMKRAYVLAALSSPSFKWPPGPYALLKVGDRVVGVIDERGLRVDRPALASSERGEHAAVLLPLRLEELEEVAESPVAASPLPPTHLYLLELLRGGCEGCGTLLVGLNGLRSSAASFKAV